MTVFLIWVGLAALLLSVYIVILWNRNRKRSRFRAKLTILFLLFVLIPTIPLTFFIANLMTESADLLLLPGMEEALETSIETLRLQVNERGIHFLNRHDPVDWNVALLEDEQIEFTGYYRIDYDTVRTILFVGSSSCPVSPDWKPEHRSLVEADSLGQSSSLLSQTNAKIIVVYQPLSDSQYILAGYHIPDHVLQARNKITHALGIYNTLSLLKESIIQKNLIWGLAVLLVLGLSFFSILSARKFSKGISKPIHSLVKGMKKVASGDLTQRVETNAKDEIRFLVDSFNKMTIDLEASRKKLIEVERLAAWREVARQIAHEIKNSITPVSISLKRLQNYFQDKQMEPSVAESLTIVDEELKSLKLMASEFSEFARMPEPQKADLSINEVVTSVIRLASNTAGQTKLETKLATDLPNVQADWEQMKRVVNNLVKNAIEASHDRGTITITTRRSLSDSHIIELEMQDNGHGMDAETQEKIFLPYFTTKKKGTGLGLAIVRKIVKDHEGDIQVESEPEKGTCICIRLK